ncbi:MAG: exodeoxyribonuclease VII small subunit [Clostridia bacterium]|nr:exodeoxyribonuclease VII small subunit [Clostridia bacterium]
MAAKKIKSFEEGLGQLEELVAELEKGDITLDRAFQVHEKGVELVKELSRMLDAGEKRLAELTEQGERALRLETEE